jgi:hypothetical protein
MPTSDLISIALPLSWTNHWTLAETETRTLPNWLRREIGIERSPKHFVRHAASWPRTVHYQADAVIDGTRDAQSGSIFGIWNSARSSS